MRQHYNRLSPRTDTGTVTEFLSAENMLRESHPGKYDHIIEKYYSSSQGIKRVRWERNGVLFLRSGIDLDVEYQLPRSIVKAFLRGRH